MCLNDKKSNILASARLRKASKGDQCTWEDYEEFKQELHRNGIFGCEQEVSDIFEL